MSIDNETFQYLIENFKQNVPEGLLTDANRMAGRNALQTIFTVMDEDKSDGNWEAIAESLGPDYGAALKVLRADMARPVITTRQNLCFDSEMQGDEIDAFMKVFAAAGAPERQPEMVYLTGELPALGSEPTNTL